MPNLTAVFSMQKTTNSVAFLVVSTIFIFFYFAKIVISFHIIAYLFCRLTLINLSLPYLLNIMFNVHNIDTFAEKIKKAGQLIFMAIKDCIPRPLNDVPPLSGSFSPLQLG
jgi:hypothetical protein